MSLRIHRSYWAPTGRPYASPGLQECRDNQMKQVFFLCFNIFYTIRSIHNADTVSSSQRPVSVSSKIIINLSLSMYIYIIYSMKLYKYIINFLHLPHN